MSFVTIISEIDIEIVDPCRNFIYLTYETLEGGYAFLGFAYNQESALDTDEGEEYQLNITDMATDSGVYNFVEKRGREVLQITSDNLDKEQIGYYRQIGISPNVYLLNNTTSPYEWLRVLVKGGSIGVHQTDGNNFSLTLEISKPELFTISN